MKTLFGFLIITLAIIVGLYIGVLLLFVGGIVDIINGIKTDFDAPTIAIGVFKFISGGFVGRIFLLTLLKIVIELLD